MKKARKTISKKDTDAPENDIVAHIDTMREGRSELILMLERAVKTDKYSRWEAFNIFQSATLMPVDTATNYLRRMGSSLILGK